jgi:hypothetical protein
MKGVSYFDLHEERFLAKSTQSSTKKALRLQGLLFVLLDLNAA